MERAAQELPEAAWRFAVTAVLVADPPWRFKDRLPGKGRGAASHYAVMSTDDICRMQTPVEREKNAVLFLWRVAAMPEDACRVARAWGFEPKAELVWEKLTRTGKPFFGMGRYTRGAHETCMICVRGKAPPALRNVRSRFAAKVGRHSSKPDEFYALVERMYQEADLFEMFARTVRPGWTQSGHELGKAAP